MRAEVAHETSPSPQAARARTSYYSPLDHDGGDPISRHLQYEDGRQAMSMSQSADTGAVHDPMYDSAEDIVDSQQAQPRLPTTHEEPVVEAPFVAGDMGPTEMDVSADSPDLAGTQLMAHPDATLEAAKAAALPSDTSADF
ncbi:hypothetical protein CYMTET_3791 [Cymbomonas tetramitiformis]|uniref:Uncharacterized protein n=1 Tax=Cymbomonas tetramitiformis TaxID=36881 RepID=A0AAE0LL59_9CHLO|nr:hypothetical protein CYMTET_3791 [Cymbomonas tetramitiformis]|eukprot:gene12598-14887_t